MYKLVSQIHSIYTHEKLMQYKYYTDMIDRVEMLGLEEEVIFEVEVDSSLINVGVKKLFMRYYPNILGNVCAYKIYASSKLFNNYKIMNYFQDRPKIILKEIDDELTKEMLSAFFNPCVILDDVVDCKHFSKFDIINIDVPDIECLSGILEKLKHTINLEVQTVFFRVNISIIRTTSYLIKYKNFLSEFRNLCKVDSYDFGYYYPSNLQAPAYAVLYKNAYDGIKDWASKNC